MKNKPQFPDHNEPLVQHAEPDTSTVGMSEDQMLLDYLIDAGFLWEEAVKLVDLREHLYENLEVRQRMADDCRMHFARWLYENREIKG